MVRISKQCERRSVSFRKRKNPDPKTGPKKDNLPKGFKPHANALSGTAQAAKMFVPKI